MADECMGVSGRAVFIMAENYRELRLFDGAECESFHHWMAGLSDEGF